MIVRRKPAPSPWHSSPPIPAASTHTLSLAAHRPVSSLACACRNHRPALPGARSPSSRLQHSPHSPASSRVAGLQAPADAGRNHVTLSIWRPRLHLGGTSPPAGPSPAARAPPSVTPKISVRQRRRPRPAYPPQPYARTPGIEVQPPPPCRVLPPGSNAPTGPHTSLSLSALSLRSALNHRSQRAAFRSCGTNHIRGGPRHTQVGDISSGTSGNTPVQDPVNRVRRQTLLA